MPGYDIVTPQRNTDRSLTFGDSNYVQTPSRGSPRTYYPTTTYQAQPTYTAPVIESRPMRDTNQIQTHTVESRVKEVEVPVYVEKQVEYVREQPKEVVKYVEQVIEVLKEVEEVVEVPYTKIVEVPVPVEKIIVKEVYVPVYHDSEFDTEHHFEHDEWTTVVKTVVQEVEVPVTKDVIVEEIEIIKKPVRKDVHVYRDVPEVVDCVVREESSSSKSKGPARQVHTETTPTVFHGTVKGQRQQGRQYESNRNDVIIPQSVLSSSAYASVSAQYRNNPDHVNRVCDSLRSGNQHIGGHDGVHDNEELAQAYQALQVQQKLGL